MLIKYSIVFKNEIVTDGKVSSSLKNVIELQ